ncbi:uracil phosphoribosyltransferase homolog, partial [Corticium candelabrum]|uniref:uracil phosphoribosyltransferase homolog n=1 Tax=Corticium candelabrum TaxID=121492 RepID=UPI002E254C10
IDIKHLRLHCTTLSTRVVLASVNSSNVRVLPLNDQIKELHTILRDRETSRSDFVFYSDRLIRLVIEEGLNVLMPSLLPETVTTPLGVEYKGAKFPSKNCGVSIMRSGEAMEKALLECCRSIRIGKILIHTDKVRQLTQTFYAKFPADIHERRVYLMHPILNSGSTFSNALEVITKDYFVPEENILVLSLFATPQGLEALQSLYPRVHVLTSEIDEVCPANFGEMYFGTE